MSSFAAQTNVPVSSSKAKLEAVESGISVFEDEFMANIVLPGGRTVSDEVRPKIAIAYSTGGPANLLPDYSGDK